MRKRVRRKMRINRNIVRIVSRINGGRRRRKRRSSIRAV
jgi:hypothetical protein